MSTNTRTTINKAFDLVQGELAKGAIEFEENSDLVAYVSDLDALIDEVRQVKKLYASRLAVIATQKSRARQKERVAKALALLEAQEKAESEGGEAAA